jgi:autotransporter-associated beta strand protein
MKSPLEQLRAWKDVVAEFLATVGFSARRSCRERGAPWALWRFGPRERSGPSQRSRNRPTSRSGRPLHRLAGFESLEPRMDVCTLFFNPTSSTLFITGATDEAISIGYDSAGYVQVDGVSTSSAANTVGTMSIQVGGGSSAIYLFGNDYNGSDTIHNVLIHGNGSSTQVYDYNNYEGYGGAYHISDYSAADYNELDGGAGTDVLSAGYGGGTYNVLYGGSGNETLNGHNGTNVLVDGGGINTLNGGSGENDLFANGGYNTLVGGTGSNNLLASNGGHNTLNGGAGDNTLDGYGGGVNTLNAGSGNNTLFGGPNDGAAIDILHGESGTNNVLYGGAGQETLYGHGTLYCASGLTITGTGSGYNLTNNASGPIALGVNADASGNVTLTSGNNTFIGAPGPITTGNAAGHMSLAKTGTGTATLSGANIYDGPTTVSSGTLALASGASLGSTAISVSPGATLSVQTGASGTIVAGSTTTSGAGASLDLTSGSTFSMTDGSTGTFNLHQQTNFAGKSLTISGATLDFDLNAAGADQLADPAGAAAVSGANTINVTAAGSSLSPHHTYNLITAASGLSANFAFADGATMESLTVNGESYTLTLENSSSAEMLTVGDARALPSSAVTGNPAGLSTYHLANGFTVAPSAVFVPSATGNYTSDPATSTTTTDTWTDSQGDQNRRVTTVQQTLQETATEASNGDWTYTETATILTTISISPITAYGTTQTETDAEHYTLTSSGHGNSSTFSFTDSRTDAIAGSAASPAAGGVESDSWSSTGSSSADVSNSRDTNVQSGNDKWTFSASSPYSYDTGDGIINGTTRTNASGGDSYSYSAMAGSYSEYDSLNSSLDGSGNYSGSASGAAESGTIAEHGTDIESEQFSLAFVVDGDGNWNQTGSGSANSTTTSSSSYAGSGAYAYASDSSGDTVSGTAHASGSQDNSSTGSVQFALDASGQWTVSSGSGEVQGSADDQSTYAASGHYHGDNGDGMANGAIDVNGDSGSSIGFTINSQWDPSSQQWTDTGSGTGASSGNDHFSYDGTRSYSYVSDAFGNVVGGSVSESSSDDSSSKASWQLTYDPSGQWNVTSGTGQSTEDVHAGASYQGHGERDLAVPGGIVYGTVDETGDATTDTNYTVNSHVDDGAWLTSGSALSTEDGQGSQSYDGAGSSSVNGLWGEIGGTLNENSHASGSIHATETDQLGADGAWHPASGTQNSTTDVQGSDSFMGQDPYSASAANTTISGTETASAQDSFSSHSATTSTLDSNGNWTTTGSGDGQDSGNGRIDYTGDASYTRIIDDSDPSDPITGSIHENGSRTGSFSFSVHSVLNADGSQTDTGSGHTDISSQDHFSFQGNGSPTDSSSSSTSGGNSQSGTNYQSQTSYNESGGDDQSSSASTKWTLDPGDVWRAATSSSEQSGSVNASYQFTFKDQFHADSSSGDSSAGTSVTSSINNSDSMAERFSDSYDNHETLTIDAHGNFNLTGSGSGSGAAHGDASHDNTASGSSDAWASDGTSSHTDSQSEDQSKQSYDFSSNWSQTFGNSGPNGSWNGNNSANTQYWGDAHHHWSNNSSSGSDDPGSSYNENDSSTGTVPGFYSVQGRGGRDAPSPTFEVNDTSLGDAQPVGGNSGGGAVGIFTPVLLGGQVVGAAAAGLIGLAAGGEVVGSAITLPVSVTTHIGLMLDEALQQGPAAYDAALKTAVLLVATLTGQHLSETQILHAQGRGLDDILANDDLFDRYVKHRFQVDKPISADDARKIWDKLVGKGKTPRLDTGGTHPGTKWTGPHINVEGTDIHIPVDPGFAPP